MTQLELHNVCLPQDIGNVMSQYRQVIYNQICQDFYGAGVLDGGQIQEFIYKKTNQELDVCNSSSSDLENIN